MNDWRDRRRERERARAWIEIMLAFACVVALLLVSGKLAKGEQRRASSTVYSQDIKSPPRAYRRHKYRYSYRRSRSRIATVSTRAAVVSQPASRAAEIPPPGAHQPSQPAVTVAGQMLLMGHWSAAYYFEPYYGHPAHAQAEPEFFGPVMLERGDPEPEPSNLHLVALGAIAAAFAAILIYAATGGQRERQPPQWAPWPDA